MGIEIIGKLTQKNNGDFKLVDLENVDYDGTGKSAKQELEKKIEEAKNSSTPYDDTKIKTDINNVKTDLGTAQLTTTNKDIKGAINEVNAQFKDIEKKTISDEERTKLTSLKNYDDTDIKLQIKEKANLNEVRKKDVNITLNDCDNSMLKAIQGGEGTTFNLLSVPRDSSVTPIKTTFFKIGLNKLDLRDTKNGYVYTDGRIVEHPTKVVTKFLQIKPGNTYIMGGSGLELNRCAYYDENKVFISMITVSNDGTFTTPANANYIVITITNSDYATNPNYNKNLFLYEGNIKPTQIENYKESFDISYIDDIPKSLIKDFVVQPYDFVDNSITPKKTTFFEETKNKVSIINQLENKYIDINGKLSDNTNYNVTDFKEIKPNTKYCCSGYRSIVFYTKEKVKISGLEGNMSKTTFTTPTNCYYFRISYSRNKTVQLQEGEVLDDFTTWNKIYIKNEHLLNNDNSFKNDNFELKLPKEIIVAVGTTIELYNEQICQCGNINNFHFLYSCSKGRTLKRKWEYTPNESDIGNSNLTVSVYNNNCEVVINKTVTIKTVKNTTSPTTPIKILQIGDSLSNDKPWYQKILDMSNSMYGKTVIEFVGTCGRVNNIFKHEGRSGYSSKEYVTNSEYGWQPNIRVQANITSVPVSKKQYKVDGRLYEFEMTKEENGITWLYFNNLFVNTGCPATSGTAIAIESGTQGDSTINYTNLEITSKNPFWDKVNNKVSMSYYENETGIKPNIVQIMLGTNGLNGDTDVTNINTLIEAIKRDWGNIPIHICCIPYYGNQNGLGVQFGNSVLDILRHKQVFEHHKKIITAFEDIENVKIVCVGQTMDREYNYGNIETNVNKYNETKELMPTEATHCQASGYYQFAEIMLSSFIDSINKL